MADRHDIEVHLATCPECAGELARYREVRTAVASLADTLETPPPGFVQRMTAAVEPEPLAGRAGRIVRDRRLHVAAASFGGAVLGAGAIALLWWRASHRVARPA